MNEISRDLNPSPQELQKDLGGNSSGKALSRRGALIWGAVKLGGLLMAVSALESCSFLGERFPRLEPVRKAFPDYKDLPRYWNADDLSSAVEGAIANTQEGSTRRVELTLAGGEIFVDRKLTFNIPDGVEVKIKAHPIGTRVRGSEELSRHPGNWGAKDNNLIQFNVGQGSSLSIDGIFFHGGSEKAGIGGYQAPDSPWDAILAIYGKDASAREIADKNSVRMGNVHLKDCHFEMSEAPGIMLQGLTDLKVEDCTSKATDCLITINMCDRGEITGCYGENLLSDFVFGVWSKNIVVENCGVNLAWAGYNFRSCQDILVRNSYAGYTLAAATTSEVIPGSNERAVGITFENFHTKGSSCVYAFQHAARVHLEGGVHDGLGEVLTAQNYIARVRNPEWIARKPIYLGPNISEITSQDLHFRKSEVAPQDYGVNPNEILPDSHFYGFES